MRVKLQPSFILHGRDYRDSSRILEVFTADHGRLSIVAKGVRGARKAAAARAGQLQPFRELLLSFSGRAEMKTLTGSEATSNTVQLLGERLFSGFYLNELLMRLLHRFDPHPELYQIYSDSLLALQGSPDADLELVLRQFEYQLLQALGYGFDLGLDGAVGEPVREDAWYGYHAEHGLVEQAQPAGPGFHGADLLALQAAEFTPTARRTAKRLMRAALASHLGDEPLRSRALFRRQRDASTGES